VVFRLKATSTSLQEVTIRAPNSGNLISTQESVSKIRLSTKQISTLPSVGEVDIFRSLQLLPGVSGTNESSSGLYVRGGTPDQNLVVLDGMTVYKVDHFYGFFSAFNANAIKDVQLFKGGFPAKYGGRLSGVVDMTGKTGSFDKVSGSAGLNLLSVNGFIEVPVAKKVSILLAGRRSFTDILQSDIYKKITGNFIAEDQQFRNLSFNNIEPEFYFYDWNAKLSVKPGPNDLISFSFYNGKDYLDQSRDLLRVIDFGSGIAPRNASLDIQEYTDWGNKAGSLKWFRKWNSKWYTNLLLASSEYFSNYDVTGRFQLTIPSEDSLVNEVVVTGVEINRVRENSLLFDNELLLNKNHSLNLGINIIKNDIEYDAVRDDTVALLSSDQDTYIYSAYISDKMQIGQAINMELGLRGSYYELTESFYYEPRINFNINLVKSFKLKAGFGHSYQFANRIINESVTEGSREFWILADDELIKVSSASQAVLGLVYDNQKWLFDVEGYYKSLHGLNEFSLRFRESAGFVPEELFFNGNGEAYGLEFLIQRLQGPLSGWISYTIGRVVYDFEELNNNRPFYALHDQLHEFKLVASYDIGNWSLATNFVFGSGKAFSEPEGFYSLNMLDGEALQYTSTGEKNGSRLPAYHRLDISVHHRFTMGKANADIGISLFNLYNRNNIWYYKFDFQQVPYLKTEVNYLGFTPNLSFSVNF
jgi:ferric enterobactin receptor